MSTRSRYRPWFSDRAHAAEVRRELLHYGAMKELEEAHRAHVEAMSRARETYPADYVDWLESFYNALLAVAALGPPPFAPAQGASESPSGAGTPTAKRPSR